MMARDDGGTIPCSSQFNDDENTHKKLIQLLKDGSSRQQQEIIACLYDAYQVPLYKFIRNKGLSPEDSQDIFSEVWKIALEKLRSFHWDDKTPPETNTPLKTFLFSTARNLYLERNRKNKKRQSLTQPLHAGLPAPTNVDTASPDISSVIRGKIQFTNDKLRTAFSKLSEKVRQILFMTYCEGKTSQEIGKILSMTPEAVRQARSRGLKQLRQTLQ